MAAALLIVAVLGFTAGHRAGRWAERQSRDGIVDTYQKLGQIGGHTEQTREELRAAMRRKLPSSDFPGGDA